MELYNQILIDYPHHRWLVLDPHDNTLHTAHWPDATTDIPASLDAFTAKHALRLHDWYRRELIADALLLRDRHAPVDEHDLRYTYDCPLCHTFTTSLMTRLLHHADERHPGHSLCDAGLHNTARPNRS